MANQLINQTLGGRYQVSAQIGEGTFARVYRVHDRKRGVDLAAKILRQDIAHEPTFIQRFKREAEVLQRLQHPNIVRYYETVETDGLVFILMDYIAGDTLQAYLYKLGQPLSVADSLQFARPLCAALSYAHGENIIHRDIKPANILLGDNGQVYITDFGIARLLGETSSLTLDSTVGTPLYMSPEQILGRQVTITTDVYAIGVLLYQMYTGQKPFVGDSQGAQGSTTAERVAYEHVNLPPKPPREHNPSLSDAAEAVVLRCLKKEPTARYSSAVAVYDALAETVGSAPLQMDGGRAEAKPNQPVGRLPEWSQVLGRVPSPETDQSAAEDEAEHKRVTQLRSPIVDSSSQALHKDSPSNPVPSAQPHYYSPTGSSGAAPARSRPPSANTGGSSFLIGALVGLAVIALLGVCALLAFYSLGLI